MVYSLDQRLDQLERLADSRIAHGDHAGALALALNFYGRLNGDQLDFVQAERLGRLVKRYVDGVETVRRLSGELSFLLGHFAANQRLHAFMLGQAGRHREARPFAERAYALNIRFASADDPTMEIFRDTLIDVLLALKEFAAVDPLLRTRLNSLATMIFPDNAIRTHNDLAIVCRHLGRYDDAAEHDAKALEISQRTDRADSLEAAMLENNRGMLAMSIGDYEAAERALRSALEIRRARLDEYDPQVVAAINNLAGVYERRGDLTAAADMLRGALEHCRAADTADVPMLLHNLGVLDAEIGDMDAAAAHLEEALAIREATLPPDHPDTAETRSVLARIRPLQNPEAAIQRAQQAVEAQRASRGPHHPDVALAMRSLAELLTEMGRFAEAEPLLEEALSIQRLSMAEDHPDVARTISNIALLYHATGDFARAEGSYRMALNGIRRGGERSLSVADLLCNLAAVCAAQGRLSEGRSMLEDALAIYDERVGQVFAGASERQRGLFRAHFRTDYDAWLTLVASDPLADAGHTLDLILRYKGIEAEALLVQREAVLGGRYSHLQAELRALADLRMRIGQYMLADAKGDPAERRNQLASLEEERESLERSLAASIPEMRLTQQLRAVDRAAVAAALPPDSALVEFVRFREIDFGANLNESQPQMRGGRYLAFVLCAGTPDRVRMIDIGPAEAIDQSIAVFRWTITGEIELPYNLNGEEGRAGQASWLSAPGWGSTKVALMSERLSVSVSDVPADLRHLGALSRAVRAARPGFHAQRLYDALIAPLLPLLAGCTKLFIAPDGNLARLPFVALPSPAGGQLIDHYTLGYLVTGRDALRWGKSLVNPGSAVVIADPDYDLGDATPSAASSMSFGPLHGTHGEGEAIAALLGVIPWLREEALEARLKAAANPSVLHIATHGYFLPDRSFREQERALRQMVTGQDKEVDYGRLDTTAGANPLLRCGLALAGANAWLRGAAPSGAAEDGILTAEDVSGLDLHGTELVVLSACETGLGDIQSGEGVFGLRRSFTIVGAKTLVMSLWKVPDSQTRDAMILFYTYLLQGKPRIEALREAQLQMRKRHPEPLYWGAFICQGEPSPLQKGLP